MGWLIIGILLLDLIMGFMLITLVYILEDIRRIDKNLKDISDKLEDLRRY